MANKLETLGQVLAQAAVSLASESEEAKMTGNPDLVMASDGMLDLRILADYYNWANEAPLILGDSVLEMARKELYRSFGPVAVTGSESLLLDYVAFARVNSLSAISVTGIPAFASLQAMGSRLVNHPGHARWNEYYRMQNEASMHTIKTRIVEQVEQLKTQPDPLMRISLQMPDFSKTYQNQATRALQTRKAEQLESKFFGEFMPGFQKLLGMYHASYNPRPLLNQTLRQSEKLNGEYAGKTISIEDFFLTPSQLTFRDFLGELYPSLWPELFDGRLARLAFDYWDRVCAYSRIVLPETVILALPVGMPTVASSIHAEVVNIPYSPVTHGAGYLSYAQATILTSANSGDFAESLLAAEDRVEPDAIQRLGRLMLLANFGLTLYAAVQKAGSGNVKPVWTGTPLNQATIAHFEFELATALDYLEKQHAR